MKVAANWRYWVALALIAIGLVIVQLALGLARAAEKRDWSGDGTWWMIAGLIGAGNWFKKTSRRFWDDRLGAGEITL